MMTLTRGDDDKFSDGNDLCFSNQHSFEPKFGVQVKFYSLFIILALY